jgi:ABC-2 type transport system permease protein
MYLRLLAVQVRSQMTYRLSFWMDLFSTMGNFIFFLAVVLVFERFENIAGWTLAEIAFLYGLIEASFGVMDMIFSGFDPDEFVVNTRQGAFDQMLLRPIGITWQVLGSKFLLRRFGRIFEGLGVLAWALTTVNVHWTMGKIFYLPLVFLSQILAMGALFIAGSTISFWTIERVEAVNILTYGGTDMMSYPAQIYPVWMQRFFTFVVPFVFLNYYPALYFLDKPDPLGFPVFAPFLAPVAAVIMFVAALRFWRVGIDHYQSAGS